MPTLQLNITLDQAHAELKSAGIAAAKLWRKSNEVGPHTPFGAEIDRELVAKLRYMQQLIAVIIGATEVK